MYFVSEMKMYFFLFFIFSSSVGLLFKYSWRDKPNISQRENCKTYFVKWEVNSKSAKKKSPPLAQYFPLAPSAAVFHYQCPNQLVKKSETQTTVLKITEFLHKCPTLPSVALGSGLRWDCRATNYTGKLCVCAPTHNIHICTHGLRFTCPNM